MIVEKSILLAENTVQKKEQPVLRKENVEALKEKYFQLPFKTDDSVFQLSLVSATRKGLYLTFNEVKDIKEQKIEVLNSRAEALNYLLKNMPVKEMFLNYFNSSEISRLDIILQFISNNHRRDFIEFCSLKTVAKNILIELLEQEEFSAFSLSNFIVAKSFRKYYRLDVKFTQKRLIEDREIQPVLERLKTTLFQQLEKHEEAYFLPPLSCIDFSLSS